jgi:hypothetical protein
VASILPPQPPSPGEVSAAAKLIGLWLMRPERFVGHHEAREASVLSVAGAKRSHSGNVPRGMLGDSRFRHSGAWLRFLSCAMIDDGCCGSR